MVGVHVTFCSYNGSIDVFKTHFTREKSTVIEAEINCCQTPSQSQSVKTVPGYHHKGQVVVDGCSPSCWCGCVWCETMTRWSLTFTLKICLSLYVS